jgi:hypothetical protein
MEHLVHLCSGFFVDAVNHQRRSERRQKAALRLAILLSYKGKLRVLESGDVSKLLEHPEIVADCEMFDDPRVLETEAVNVLDFEFPSIRREGRTSQGWNQLKVAEVCPRKSNFTHHGVLLRHGRIDSESEVWKCASPDGDDVLDNTSYLGIWDSEIDKLRREELIDSLGAAFVPQHFKMLPDAFLVGIADHMDSPKP